MQPVTRLARPSRFAAAALVASMYFSGSAALAQDLVISGVIDGPLTGGTPKAVEIYVINDVADLSVYGLGSANNGGGSDGEEFTFPAAAASAGQYLYVASEAPQFTAFFGAAPDYTSSAASINGDDAIELFQNGSVIDVFGDIDVDGTGQPWDHVDGWAYRVSDTGPDGATFVLANWSFSGPNALDGETSNATAATPFPAGTFTTAGGDAAPRVRATIPADGAGNVAVDADIEIVFSEPVTATEPWFDLSCSASLGRTATPSSADNVTFTLSVDGDFDTGESCSLTILAAGIADIDSDDPPDNPAADIVIGFDIETGLPAPVVINEIHADPDTAEGDANRDGAANFSDDEFVEIVNVSGADLDVGGWTLADGVSVRHTFPAGTVIDAGCAIVVFGGGTPAGAFGGAAVQTASSGALGLNNGGDTVTVSDGAADVASVGYGGEGGNNQALTRNPDLSGAFEQHLGVSGTRYSPGTEAGGGAFAGCTFVIPLVAIHDLQGVGDATPLAGQSVRIEGVVTGDFQDNDADTDNNLRGFYVQQQQPDGDPLTSEGVFVFDGVAPGVDVNAGDRVSVTGTAVEFFGDTQVAATVVEVIGSGSVAPVNVALPAAAVVLNDNGEFIPDLERFEGMLVTFPDTLTVTELFNLDRFGEVHLAAGGRPLQFTNDNAPSVAGFEQHLREIGARHVMLDDGQTVQNPDPIRYLGPGQANGQPDVLRLGATVTGLTGTLRFGRGSGGSGDPLYRLNPTTGTVTFGDGEGSQRPPAGAPLPGARYRYRYASVNVLNFFTTLDVPGNTCGPSGLDCRGANSQAEFDRQFAKLVTTLLELDADVVGLVELENNAAASLATIVDALNAELGAGTWGYVDTGVIGGDAIKVGLIYDTTTTAALGDFAILDSSVDVRFIDTKNRPVLAQTFQDLATAGVVTVAVNHLKSKGSPCDDVGDPNAGDGQGNCNGTRTLAAEAMIDWLAGDPTGSGDPDVLVLGDLNAYLREDPVQAFRDAGWTNLLDVFIGPGAYSFAFDRQIGALDHAIATPSLAAQVTGTVEWHINADEPDAIDYNLDFGRNPGIFDGAIPFRSSDHDPVVVGLELTGDLDGDGVADDIDVCPATIIPEATVPSRRLIGRRYALVDDDTVFDKASRFGRTYTTADTAGCSCEQIIEATVPGWFGWLNRKYGCSNGLMRWWVRSVSH